MLLVIEHLCNWGWGAAFLDFCIFFVVVEMEAHRVIFPKLYRGDENWSQDSKPTLSDSKARDFSTKPP